MVWDACKGSEHITSLRGTLYRLVEDQEQVATLEFVDTLDEQAMLEELLEEGKPPYPLDNNDTLHYLLKTPFRYPPLEWGSRFGRKNEPSIFYGGCSIEVTLTESAYYRFVFWDSMQGPSPQKVLRSQHSMFSVEYKTSCGVRLYKPPFDSHTEVLTSVSSYTTCQLLGSDMREAGVQAFEYLSARCPNDGVCIGLFSDEPFEQHELLQQTKWLCDLSDERVLFKSVNSNTLMSFSIELFLQQGNIPLPA